MALSVLNNIASLAAQNQLSITNANLQKSLFQLSSGSRINTGADDAAGLAIADGLQANITALTQSARNANDGVGELQVADGSLAQITTLLNRAVTLATESATGTVSDSQRVALNDEYVAIKAEIDRVGSKTNYNGGQVFTNSSLNVFLSDGGATSNSTIAVTTGLLSSTNLSLAGTPAVGTLQETVANANGVKAGITFNGGGFVGSTKATAVLTGATFQGVQNATATLTTAASPFTVATAATGTLTGSATNSLIGSTDATKTITLASVTANDTITVGSQTYTFKAALTGGANEIVFTNATDAATHLIAAINGSGTSAGVYGVVTAQSATTGVHAVTGGAGVLTVNALTDGLAGGVNVNGATAYTGTGSATDSALTAGADGDTVTVGGQLYHLVQALSTTVTANEVVVGTGSPGTNDNTTTLQNLQWAVNKTAGHNATYSQTTAQNTAVTASGGGGLALTFTANVKGVGTGGQTGNGITVSTNDPGAGTVAGFNNAVAGSTVTINGQTYNFVNGFSTTATANEIQASSGVLLTELQNLDAAVNGSTNAITPANFGGTRNDRSGAGVAYSASTAVNTGAVGLSTGAAAVNGGIGTVTFTAVSAGAIAIGAAGNAATAVSTNGNNSNFGTTSTAGGSAADTVTVGGQTYTFVNTLAGDVTAYHVLAGTEAQSLTNLVDAVNGVGAGTNYTSGAANTAAAGVADANGTTATFTALVNGVGTGGETGNNIDSTVSSAHGGSFSNAKFQGGSGGNTVTLGTGNVYTFVNSLSASAANIANEVLLGTNEANTLTHLAEAVGGVTNKGTDFSNATVANGSVVASASNNTTVTLQATGYGTGGNSTVVSVGAGTLPGATAVGNFITSTGATSQNTTLWGGTGAITGGGPANAGDTVTIGDGTLFPATTYTFVNQLSTNPAVPNQVLVGATNNQSLQNLVAAINGASGAGTAYGAGTVPNTDVQASYSAGSNGITTGVVTLTALVGGIGGNGIVTSTSAGDNTFGAATLTGGGTAPNDLLSQNDATAALATINSAVQSVAALRGSIGATINRLQSAGTVITNQVQNLTGAEDGVRAADIPSTVATLAKYSILEQTGISALAQANQQQQLVLKLLQ